jgi:hypothetical protein
MDERRQHARASVTVFKIAVALATVLAAAGPVQP